AFRSGRVDVAPLLGDDRARRLAGVNARTLLLMDDGHARWPRFAGDDAAARARIDGGRPPCPLAHDGAVRAAGVRANVDPAPRARHRAAALGAGIGASIGRGALLHALTGARSTAGLAGGLGAFLLGGLPGGCTGAALLTLLILRISADGERACRQHCDQESSHL